MPSNVSGDPYFGLSRAGRRRLRAEYSRRYEQRLTERDGFLRSRLEPGEVILAASAAHGFVTDRRILSAHQLRQPPRAGAWVCESLGYAQIRGWMVGSQHDGRPLIRLMHEPVLRPQHLPAHRFLWFEWGDAEGEAPHTTTLLAFNRVSYPVFVALREALEGASIPQGEPFAFRPEGTRQERMGMGANMAHDPTRRIEPSAASRAVRWDSVKRSRGVTAGGGGASTICPAGGAVSSPSRDPVAEVESSAPNLGGAS